MLTVAPSISAGHLSLPGRDRELLVARTAHVLLLGSLAIVYSGGERYFYLVSRPLEYGFDLLIVGCIVVLVSTNGIRSAYVEALPYMAFVMAYTAWGLIVSPIQSQIASAAAGAAVLNLILFAGVFLAVRDRASLGILAFLIQLAALVNIALVLWEAADSTVTKSLASFAQTVYYVLERPGGLWIQPNDAAVALLFAVIVSFWARGPRSVIWLARLGSAVAIFLTASRTGMYPLILCAVLFGAHAIATNRLDRRLWIVILGFGGAVAIVGGAVVLVAEGQVLSNSLATNYDLARFLDIGQSLRTASDPSRTADAQMWLATALNGPWQGSGIYSFQGSLTLQGAHDMYIMILGETGVATLIAYLCVLAFGVSRAFRKAIPTRDRVALFTLWAVYLAIGLSTHTQFSSVVGIIVIALLYRLSSVLSDPGSSRSTGETRDAVRSG